MKSPLFLAAAVFSAVGHLAAAPSAWAATETTLYAFSSTVPAPSTPEGTLTIDKNGNIFGTTFAGGTYGEGTAYKLLPDGSLAVLHDFAGEPDAVEPQAGVIEDSLGNLYGTTFEGGKAGFGAVFVISPSGKEGVLSMPALQPSDNPNGGLLFYSSSSVVGAVENRKGGVFQVTKPGTLTMRTVFSKSPGQPLSTYFGTLAMDSHHTLYGVAGGGANGKGCVYSLSSTNVLTVLYSLTASDGAPNGGLAVDSSGNVYGTTFSEVYKITPTGQFSILLLFPTSAGQPGGLRANGGVILDSARNLYGTTFWGGQVGDGVVYKVSPSGQETVLYSFTGGSDGQNPGYGLVEDASGAFYGVAAGGVNGGGVIYKITP